MSFIFRTYLSFLHLKQGVNDLILIDTLEKKNINLIIIIIKI